MNTVDFMLVATGSPTIRTLNIALLDSFAEGAKMEAQSHVATLHKAGYTRFTLYNTQRKDGAADFQIATFRVGYQEPHIIME